MRGNHGLVGLAALQPLTTALHATDRQTNKQTNRTLPLHKALLLQLGFSFFLSSMAWHTLPSHASAEACLIGWDNAQPQGWD